MAYTPIDKSDDYFSILLWTGDGTSGRDITGVGFQPDWVWIKNRDNGSRYHTLNDSVRGVNRQLFSNVANAEETDTGQLQAFISDGFTVGSNANVNENTSGFVSFNWLASNSTASNTNGSITSTVSANTTSGFSIVSYTGTGSTATVGHGLGVTPAMIIVKDRTNGGTSWVVWNKNFSSLTNNYLTLNTQNSTQTFSNYWGTSAPTSSVFGVGSGGLDNNRSSANIIAYCFAEIKGFSKFGSYTGNGSTNGAFVYTGFKPAWVVIKRTDSTSNWTILDNKRYGYNQASVSPREMYTNSADAESNSGRIDIVSNGFKLRSVGTDANGNGNSYVYMAFAENPFVTSTGIPTCAN